MGGAYLDTDTGLALRHHRIIESRDEDAFFLQLGGELLRQRSVVEHHGADGGLRRLAVEASLGHLLDEVFGVGVELVLQCVGLAHHLEHADASGHEARSHRVGEEVRTAALTQHVDDFLTTRGEATHGTAEGLTEGTSQDLMMSFLNF